jgi:protein-tyrosine phosphatase
MGNICRSPMAELVTQKMLMDAGLASQFHIESAGTHASHLGERPDPRAEAALLRRGYRLGRARSRKVRAKDFESFDLILAMDSNNLSDLRRIGPPEHLSKIRLFLDFGDDKSNSDVPDPYYGNTEGFERVLDLCEAGARGLVKYYSR